MYPGMFEDYANLRPWKGAAEILAKDADWPRLYDTEQLAKNEVKVNAITYVLLPFSSVWSLMVRFIFQ